MYPYIVLDRNPHENPLLRSKRRDNLERIRGLPSGTLVFWDALFGPWYFDVRAEDFEFAGFQRVEANLYDLKPRLPWPSFLQEWTKRRRQRIDIFVKGIPSGG